MLRHQNSRDSETEEKKLQRKKKDKEYQREKRSLESLHDKNVRKQKDVEYRYLKRIEEKEANSKKWLEIHRQRNLEPLKKHGLYFRYLLFGTPQEYHFMVNLYQLSKILNLLMIGNGLKTEPQKKYSWHRNFKWYQKDMLLFWNSLAFQQMVLSISALVTKIMCLVFLAEFGP